MVEPGLNLVLRPRPADGPTAVSAFTGLCAFAFGGCSVAGIYFVGWYTAVTRRVPKVRLAPRRRRSISKACLSAPADRTSPRLVGRRLSRGQSGECSLVSIGNGKKTLLQRTSSKPVESASREVGLKRQRSRRSEPVTAPAKVGVGGGCKLATRRALNQTSLPFCPFAPCLLPAPFPGVLVTRNTPHVIAPGGPSTKEEAGDGESGESALNACITRRSQRCHRTRPLEYTPSGKSAAL